MDLESIKRAIKANKNEYDSSELTIRRRQARRRKEMMRPSGTRKEQLAAIS